MFFKGSSLFDHCSHATGWNSAKNTRQRTGAAEFNSAYVSPHTAHDQMATIQARTGKTKAELYEMLAEAVRNTQIEKRIENKYLEQVKKGRWK